MLNSYLCPTYVYSSGSLNTIGISDAIFYIIIFVCFFIIVPCIFIFFIVSYISGFIISVFDIIEGGNNIVRLRDFEDIINIMPVYDYLQLHRSFSLKYWLVIYWAFLCYYFLCCYYFSSFVVAYFKLVVSQILSMIILQVVIRALLYIYYQTESHRKVTKFVIYTKYSCEPNLRSALKNVTNIMNNDKYYRYCIKYKDITNEVIKEYDQLIKNDEQSTNKKIKFNITNNDKINCDIFIFMSTFFGIYIYYFVTYIVFTQGPISVNADRNDDTWTNITLNLLNAKDGEHILYITDKDLYFTDNIENESCIFIVVEGGKLAGYTLYKNGKEVDYILLKGITIYGFYEDGEVVNENINDALSEDVDE